MMLRRQKFLTSIAAKVVSCIHPDPAASADRLRFWQERVLRTVLFAGVIFGFVAYVPSLWLSLKERLWLVALVDSLVYAGVIIVFFRDALPYELRSGFLVVISYLLGMVLLVVVGPFGAGPVWLFAFPVIAGILLGFRASLAALGVNAITLIAIGAAIRLGIIHWPIPAENPMAKWLVSSVNFMVLDAVVTISITVVLRGLRTSLEQEKSLRVAVEESEARLKTIVDSVHTGILIIAADTHRISDVNPAAAGMIGTHREDIIGRSCRDFLDEAVFFDRFERQETAVSSESTLNTIGGGQRPIMISIDSVSLKSRPHLLASFLDISRLRQAEQDRATLEAQLAKAQKMEALGTLAGGIAHDFNNILAGIFGFTELALEQVDDGSQTQNDLLAVLAATQRARELVQQILAFSRRGQGRLQTLRVKPLVTEALKLFHASLPAGIDLRTAFSDDPVARIDPTQFHQVLMNLLVNARHAMNDYRGVIEVGFRANDVLPAADCGKAPENDAAFFHLWVRDQGCGMPPAVAAQIFEPFFTTRPDGQGTGMGLAVVHGIVEGHGGVITVDSAPGVGTLVDLYLPQGIANDIVTTVDRQAALGGAERILVVDDDDTVLAVTARTLEGLGYTVIAERKGASALALLKQRTAQVDLVVTDNNMPEMTGIQLMAAMKGLRPGLPVILYTGDAGHINAKAAADLGAAAFAVKPLSRTELAQLIRRGLDGGIQNRPLV